MDPNFYLQQNILTGIRRVEKKMGKIPALLIMWQTIGEYHSDIEGLRKRVMEATSRRIESLKPGIRLTMARMFNAEKAKKLGKQRREARRKFALDQAPLLQKIDSGVKP